MTWRTAFLVGAAIIGKAGAETAPRPSPFLDAFATCRAMQEVAQRAECYDRAYDALSAARAKKEVVIVDRESVRETRKGMFGFTGPRLPFLGNDDDDTPKQVDTTIASVREIARDVYRIRLADGAVWQTTDEMTGIPKAGSEIHIRRTTMGGYALSLGRGRAVRAIRIQ